MKIYFPRVLPITESTEDPIFWLKAESYQDACQKLDLRVEGSFEGGEWQAYEKTSGKEIYLLEFDEAKEDTKIKSPEDFRRLVNNIFPFL